MSVNGANLGGANLGPGAKPQKPAKTMHYSLLRAVLALGGAPAMPVLVPDAPSGGAKIKPIEIKPPQKQPQKKMPKPVKEFLMRAALFPGVPLALVIAANAAMGPTHTLSAEQEQHIVHQLARVQLADPLPTRPDRIESVADVIRVAAIDYRDNENWQPSAGTRGAMERLNVDAALEQLQQRFPEEMSSLLTDVGTMDEAISGGDPQLIRPEQLEQIVEARQTPGVSISYALTQQHMAGNTEFLGQLGKVLSHGGENINLLPEEDSRALDVITAAQRDVQPDITVTATVAESGGLLDLGSWFGSERVAPIDLAAVEVATDLVDEAEKLADERLGYALERLRENYADTPIEGAAQDMRIALQECAAPQAALGLNDTEMFAAMMSIARRESGFRETVKAPNSSALGYFQFLDATWLLAFQKHGAAIGFSPELMSSLTEDQIKLLRRDGVLNAVISCHEMVLYHDALKNAGLEQPQPHDYYTAHFLGTRGAGTLVQIAYSGGDDAAQRRAMVENFTAAAASNPSVMLERYPAMRANESQRAYRQRLTALITSGSDAVSFKLPLVIMEEVTRSIRRRMPDLAALKDNNADGTPASVPARVLGDNADNYLRANLARLEALDVAERARVAEAEQARRAEAAQAARARQQEIRAKQARDAKARRAPPRTPRR